MKLTYFTLAIVQAIRHSKNVQIEQSSCTDSSNGETDAYGDGCEWYDWNAWGCGMYDTDSFFANDMCCGCAAPDYGECENSANGATDDYGDGCEWYDLNVWGCGQYNTETFDSNAMCCACSGAGSSTGDDGQDWTMALDAGGDTDGEDVPAPIEQGTDEHGDGTGDGSGYSSTGDYDAPSDVTPWSIADGQTALGFMNDFRADPESIQPTPPKQVGTAVGPYQWSDELFDLAMEHSINQAEVGSISHDGVSERFDRVTSCSVWGWGENVAYNMESGEAALQSAITQWAESTSGHRENMLDQTYTHAAVAAASKVAEEPYGSYGYSSVYFTAKFMRCG